MFLAFLTVLTLITTVWVEILENSYLRHFSAQVSQIVFLTYLTVLRLITTVGTWNVTKLISPPFQCTSITNGVLSLFDRFTAYYNYMSWNGRKLISPPFQCTSITNRVLSLFDHFTTYYNCMSGNLRKLVSPRFQCRSITNRVLTLFDSFTAYYNYITWNVRKLISPPIQWTSITNRVLAYLTVLRLITTVWPKMSENSYLRHFSAQVSQIVFLAYLIVLPPYYNCMMWNVRKLISPPFQCTSITNRVLSLFDRFTSLLQLYESKSQQNSIRDFSAKYHKIVFLAYLTVLRLITTLWPEMSKNSYLRHFSAQVSQLVFLVYLTVSRLITTV